MFQVEELRRDLRIKSQELEVKNAAANDKLKKMVKDQQEAEKKKVSFISGSAALVSRRFSLRGGWELRLRWLSGFNRLSGGGAWGRVRSAALGATRQVTHP